MVKFCTKCGKVINHGERVELMFEGTFVLLPSTKHWALDPNKLTYIDDTLAHVECEEEDEVNNPDDN